MSIVLPEKPVGTTGPTVTEPTPPPIIPPPGPKPDPTLQAAGFLGSIGDFNAKVQQYTDQHQTAYGYKPTANAALQAAVSPEPKPVVLPSAAKAAADVQRAGTAPDPLQQVAASVATGNAAKTVEQLHDEIAALPAYKRQAIVALSHAKDDAAVQLPWQIDPKLHNDGLMSLDDKLASTRIVDQLAAGKISRTDAYMQWTQHLDAMADSISGKSGGTLNRIVSALARVPEQATDGLVHAPGGIYQVGKAVGKDAIDFGTGKDLTFLRTREIGKQIGLSTYRDIKDPEGRSGFLVMDLLGAAGAVGGAVARVGAAGDALSAGEGLGAAVKAAAKRPVGGNATLTALRSDESPGISVSIPLSDNPTRALVQQWRLARKQAALDSRSKGGLSAAAIIPDTVGKYLSPEGLISRRLDAAGKIQQTIDLEVKRELERASGWTKQASGALSVVPDKLWRGLSVGEQKAIWSIALDDPTPIATQVNAHLDWIDKGIGSPAEHGAQIQALYLAADVLRQKGLDNLIGDLPDLPAGMKPGATKVSGRFDEALGLAREASEFQQALKVEHLGLTPQIAEGSVAKLGHVYRGGEFVENQPGVVTYTTPAQFEGKLKVADAKTDVVPVGQPTDRAFYIPREIAMRRKIVPRNQKNEVRTGQYGIPNPDMSRLNPELDTEFTGNSVRLGKIRFDTTNMIAEQVGRTVRNVAILQQYKKLYDGGLRELPKGANIEDYTPIRGVDGVPDQLRELVNKQEGLLTKDEIAKLSDAQELTSLLSPTRTEATRIPDVRWVPNHMVGPGARTLQILSPGAQTALQLGLSTPQRFAYFFTRPAYALNMLGNVPMTLIHQGVLAGPNIFRAMKATELYGQRNADTLRALMGQGKNTSYIDEKFSSRLEKTAAHYWSRLNDEAFRTSALIHEARRRGYGVGDTPEAENASMHDFLHSKDPKVIEDRNAAIKKARDAMVNMDGLTPLEAELLRHVIFVYPWMSRSAVWSLQTILDHPMTSDVLAHVGDVEKDADPIFKNAPEWFKRIGYFSFGHSNDGTPQVLNPTSVWSFATMGDLYNLGEAVTKGSPNNSLSDMFGPGPTALVHAATGRDQFGQSYKGSQWLAAAKEALTGLPQVSAYERGGKKNAALPPIDITDRETLIKRTNAALKQTVFTPGWLDGYGTLITGGLTPRGADLTGLTARAEKEATPQDRQKWQLSLINKALEMQADALGRTVPPQVRKAVNISADLGFQTSEYLRNENPQATQKDLDKFQIDYLASKGLLSEQDAAKYRNSLGKLIDENDHRQFRAAMSNKVTGNNLPLWDADVRQIGLFVNRESLQKRADQLAADGLAPKVVVSGDDKTLLDAGRKLVEYSTEAKMLARQIAADTTSDADRIKLRAELSALDDKYDHPVVVSGKVVSPSPLRVGWTDLPDDVKQAHRDSLVTRNWGDLSRFERDVLGKPSSQDVADGWALYHQVVAGYRSKNKQGLDADQKLAVAQQIDQGGYHGFLSDYKFAQQPLAARVSSMTVVTKSAFKDYWKQILGNAQKVADAIKSGDTNGAEARSAWNDWATQAYEKLKVGEPAFYQELQRYPRILYKLVSN